jgi:hypothetical protein
MTSRCSVTTARADRRRLCFVAALALGCGPGLAPDPAPEHPSARIRSLDYRFAVAGFGFSESALVGSFESVAFGRLELVPLDDPPLIVGALVVERMELYAADQRLSSLAPGEWSFMARRTAEGAVDGLWLTAEVPSEVEALTRALVGELQRANPGIRSTMEETPVGRLESRYGGIDGGFGHAVFRARAGRTGIHEVAGATVFFGDMFGAITVTSALVSRTPVVDGEALVAANFVFALRHASRPLMELSDIRRRIEVLSAGDPVSLLEPAQTRERDDARRRAAETWEDLAERLRVAKDTVDPISIARAAAYLSEDDALVDELASMLSEATPTGVVAMVASLGECGTDLCQALLIDQLAALDPARAAGLAALARVREPSASTVDHLLELCHEGDETTRSSAGIVLSRFADSDPKGAEARLALVIGGFPNCPAQLDAWLGLLGNAGLAASKPTLLACVDSSVTASRRAGAARALRRVPGVDVTEVLVGLAIDDPDERVQLASLRALAQRNVADFELAPLVATPNFDEWGPARLEALLDVLENVEPPEGSVMTLLDGLAHSEHTEVAERSRRIASQ